MAPQPAPAPPPQEPPLSSYTTDFVSAVSSQAMAWLLVIYGRILTYCLRLQEPAPDRAGFQKWSGTQAWCGPDVRPSAQGLVGHAESGAMEGRRYWPGEGVIPKYPNGCQDRCFAATTDGSTCALGIFDGSGGENAEKVEKPPMPRRQQSQGKKASAA